MFVPLLDGTEKKKIRCKSGSMINVTIVEFYIVYWRDNGEVSIFVCITIRSQIFFLARKKISKSKKIKKNIFFF